MPDEIRQAPVGGDDLAVLREPVTVRERIGAPGRVEPAAQLHEAHAGLEAVPRVDEPASGLRVPQRKRVLVRVEGQRAVDGMAHECEAEVVPGLGTALEDLVQGSAANDLGTGVGSAQPRDDAPRRHLGDADPHEAVPARESPSPPGDRPCSLPCASVSRRPGSPPRRWLRRALPQPPGARRSATPRDGGPGAGTASRACGGRAQRQSWFPAPRRPCRSSPVAPSGPQGTAGAEAPRRGRRASPPAPVTHHPSCTRTGGPARAGASRTTRVWWGRLTPLGLTRTVLGEDGVEGRRQRRLGIPGRKRFPTRQEDRSPVVSTWIGDARSGLQAEALAGLAGLPGGSC